MQCPNNKHPSFELSRPRSFPTHPFKTIHTAVNVASCLTFDSLPPSARGNCLYSCHFGSMNKQVVATDLVGSWSDNPFSGSF